MNDINNNLKYFERVQYTQKRTLILAFKMENISQDNK